MNVDETGQLADDVLAEVSRAVIADQTVLETILAGIVSRGHVLLEDVPGTGKTLTARSFAAALGLSFSRVQFTPDLLPADVTGSYVYNEATGEFEFNQGPLFANIVLADEINRASPKTQAALLEAMEEKQVTVDGETWQLPEPFFVIATQNPVEQGEGTFPLPEAQQDRFLVKTSLGYPETEGGVEMLMRRGERDEQQPQAEQAVATEDLHAMQSVPERVDVTEDLARYVVEVVEATRDDPRVTVGVSPRGAVRLFEMSRSWAALSGRGYVIPDDVKAVAHPVLDHRLVLTADARVNDVTKESVVADVLEEVPVPRVNREPATAQH
ncbi:AAA family ATPase [Haloarchaeobius amylolyticus]|uniref:AAA family ATPase n=1 Tax=Haloarchaeobius amylolyticus TaxID=1198296 RepID=UPI00226D89C8|nr:MoxR family ATPase [Haloarchaeobius amylolyticus]